MSCTKHTKPTEKPTENHVSRPFMDAAKHASVAADKSLSQRSNAPATSGAAKPMLLRVLYCLANSTTCAHSQLYVLGAFIMHVYPPQQPRPTTPCPAGVHPSQTLLVQCTLLPAHIPCQCRWPPLHQTPVYGIGGYNTHCSAQSKQHIILTEVVGGGSLADDGGCHVPRTMSRSMLQSTVAALADVSGTAVCSASCG